MKTTDFVDSQYLKTDLPDFGPGDEVKVHVRVVEGNHERVQVFQGNVIAIQGGGVQESFTVRKVELQHRRGAHVPEALADDRQDRSRAPWRCAPGEAVLPARSQPEGRQDPRKRDR